MKRVDLLFSRRPHLNQLSQGGPLRTLLSPPRCGLAASSLGELTTFKLTWWHCFSMELGTSISSTQTRLRLWASQRRINRSLFLSREYPVRRAQESPHPPPFFWPHHTSCRILVPQLEIKPGPTTVRAPSPNYWTDTEVQGSPKFIRGLSASNPDQLSPRAKVSLLFHTV